MNIKQSVSKIKELLLSKAQNSLGDIHYKVEGRYELTVIKPDGSSSVVAEFPNLITNGGLDRIGSGSAYLSYIHLGTGSTTPAFTDISLATFRASSGTAAPTGDQVTSVAGSSPYYAQYDLNKRFAAGIANGNLTEVGVSWNSVTGSLFSRALILDGAGNPTTITLLADEVLDVKYSLRVYAPLVDVSATVNGYATVLRAANVTNTSEWRADYFAASIGSAYATQILGAITGLLSGSAYGQDSNTFNAYVNGTYTRTGQLSMGLTAGNVPGGIGSLTFRVGFGRYQVSFTPVIPKDTTKVLTITWSVSWGRV